MDCVYAETQKMTNFSRVICRAATRVRRPRQLPCLDVAKYTVVAPLAVVWLSCLPKIYRGGPDLCDSSKKTFFKAYLVTMATSLNLK